MIIVPPIPFRPKRKSQLGKPPAALTLIAAEYQAKAWVRLTFDRAIDIASLDPAQVQVDDDQDSGWRLGGQGGATLVDPMTVQVPLDRIGDSTESGVHLFVSASSGIVASGDGGAWAGVSDVALPFP